MGIFGDKKEPREDIAELLLEASGRIMEKGVNDIPSAELVKIAIEYNDMIIQNCINQDRFLVERMEKLVNIIQKEKKYAPNKDGQYIIKLFETIPDFIKDMKVRIENNEHRFIESKKQGVAFMKLMDDITSKLESKE